MKLFGMYGTQMTFKACGLLVASTCMVSILFVFCLDSRLFNFVWSPGKRVSCISSLWLLVTLLYGLNTFPSTALSFVVYKTINKYILYLASYFNLIYSLDSWTLGHFFVVALFVRKTCTLYDMVLKRHKMNSPNFKVYSTIYLSLWGSNGRSGGPWQTKLVSHCMNFLDLRMLSKVIVLPYPGTFKIQKGNYHYQLTE